MSAFTNAISIMEGFIGFTGDDPTTEEEYIESYCNKMGIDHIPNWPFYLAFGFFRLAGIAQGVYKRSIMGNASAKNAGELGAAVPILGKIANDIIQSK